MSASVRDHVTLCGGVCKHVNRTCVLCVTGFDCVLSLLCAAPYTRVCVCVLYVQARGIAATTVQPTRNVYRARNPSFFIPSLPRSSSFSSSSSSSFSSFFRERGRCFSFLLPTIPKETLSCWCYGPAPYKLPVFGEQRDGEIVRIRLYRFFEKRFRLQYSIRRPRAERYVRPSLSILLDRDCLRKQSLRSSTRATFILPR